MLTSIVSLSLQRIQTNFNNSSRCFNHVQFNLFNRGSHILFHHLVESYPLSQGSYLKGAKDSREHPALAVDWSFLSQKTEALAMEEGTQVGPGAPVLKHARHV